MQPLGLEPQPVEVWLQVGFTFTFPEVNLTVDCGISGGILRESSQLAANLVSCLKHCIAATAPVYVPVAPGPCCSLREVWRALGCAAAPSETRRSSGRAPVPSGRVTPESSRRWARGGPMVTRLPSGGRIGPAFKSAARRMAAELQRRAPPPPRAAIAYSL